MSYEYYDYEDNENGFEMEPYDGADYILDDFGERILNEADADDAAIDAMAEDEMVPDAKPSDAFGESIGPAEVIHEEAEAAEVDSADHPEKDFVE